MSNCRINPTVNGLPHLGHLYLALVNYHHSTGGTMSLVYDDNQPAWISACGRDAMARYSDAWFTDMEWAGIKFDKVVSQASLESEITELSQYLNITPHSKIVHVPALAGSEVALYPYSEWLTFEKVYIDAMLGINLLIRGIDLMPEFALYNHWWYEAFDGEPPRHVYLPRLQYAHGGQIDTVSKTLGTHKLATYRAEGYAPDDVIALLREACLIDPLGEFRVTNIKRQPILRDDHTKLAHTFLGGR